jgi:curved DNA-binding protein
MRPVATGCPNRVMGNHRSVIGGGAARRRAHLSVAREYVSVSIRNWSHLRQQRQGAICACAIPRRPWRNAQTIALMKYADYYKIMGVARTATDDEIKKSYRRLARKYHPDVSVEKDAEARFKEVQEAYEVLKDSEKRATYDGGHYRAHGEPVRPPPHEPSGPKRRRGRSPTDQAASFYTVDEFEFGAGYSDGGHAGSFNSAGSTPRAGRGRLAHVEIDLEEAFSGTTRTIEVNGNSNKKRTVRVNIPAGVTKDEVICLAGQGGPGRSGGKAGALYLTVHIRPHRLFQLEGRNVRLILPVAPWEAALGGRVRVPTLGQPVDMVIPAGAQAGQTLRLRGRGLPGNEAGDQYVQLKIVLPQATSARARALYEEMHRTLAFDPRADLGG